MKRRSLHCNISSLILLKYISKTILIGSLLILIKPTLALSAPPPPANVTLTATTGTTSGNFSTIKDAFDAINAGTHQGVIVININSTTSETASAVLNGSGTGSAIYSSINMYPTATGLSITSSAASSLIQLNGASNITIDGRVNATGSLTDLTITNPSTGTTSVIEFINGASSNTIKYCTLKAMVTNSGNAILKFNTTNTTTGNSNNTIEHNDLTTSNDGSRAYNVIYSLGTASHENSSNTITNNNIYNFFKRIGSTAISLSSNTTAWSIIGNSFYETNNPFATSGSGDLTVISITNTSGNNFTISGNFIGGSAAHCGGNAWNKNTSNNKFTAINLNVGTTTATNVQNNRIQNFTYANSGNADWYGINITGGDVNIGTTNGNTIGSATGTGSITLTAATTGANFYGINSSSTGLVSIQNDTIAGITVSNSATLATNFYGIYKSSSAGTTTMSNNIIGSTTTANSINASSNSTANVQKVFGISSSGTGSVTISGNTIANLTNGTTNTDVNALGATYGISVLNGTNTLRNNIINNLSNANGNSNVTITPSVAGILLNNLSSVAQAITGNRIYNLSNSFASFSGGVIGLLFGGGTTASDISGNFLSGLSVSGNTVSSPSLYGIKILSGNSTYTNNIVSIGGNSLANLYGIFESGAIGNDNKLYFNTVNIEGSPASGTNPSYALWSDASTNTRNFRNNILANLRSTTGGTNLHYAAYLNYDVATNLTMNYNNYYVSGTGGTTGHYNGTDKTDKTIVTDQDLNSLSQNPVFPTPVGTLPTNYIPALTASGVGGTGITTDYAGATRGATPKMGAYESCAAPPAPTAIGTTICSGNTANLTSTGMGTQGWYDAPSGGNWLHGGSSFTTPVLNSTTTYYVQDSICVSSQTRSVVVVTITSMLPTFTTQPGYSACVGTNVTYTTEAGKANYTWVIPGTLNSDYTITSGGTTSDNSLILKWLTEGSKIVTVNYTLNGCSAANATSSTPTTISLSSGGTALTSGPLAVGMSYQGGIIAYILQSGDPDYSSGQTKGLIAASADQSSSIWWNLDMNSLTNSSGSTIGTGMINTEKIISVQGQPQINYAAGLARSYGGGGYTDWFLPSYDELNLMYLNIGPGGLGANMNIGNFAPEWYWTSTEYDQSDPWSQHFDQTGQLGGQWKTAPLHVRAARYFTALTSSAPSISIPYATSTTLSASGYTGSTLKWQKSVDGINNWTDVTDGSGFTSASYTTPNLSATTYYRIMVTSGTCDAAYSTTATVIVNPLPTITAAVAATGVCASQGSQTTTLAYSATTETPTSYSIVWDSTPLNNFSAVTDSPLPASPINITLPAAALAGTYRGTLTVKNANNCVSRGSSFTLKINSSPVVSISASADTTFCTGNSVNLAPASNISSLTFNGSSGYVSVPHNSGQVATQMTIEGWIYLAGTSSGGGNILMKGNYGYGIHIGADGCSSGNKLGYWVTSQCGTTLLSSGTIPSNIWTHIAVVVTTSPAKTLSFYINGVLSGSSNSSDITINNGGNGPLYIGTQGTCFCNFFNGKMDEIRLWNTARTQEQIQSTMNKEVQANSANLQLYLKADNANGTMVTDYSTNGTNGTFNGGMGWDISSKAPLLNYSSYLWSPGGQTTSSINVTTSGKYALSITDENGCSAISREKTVTTNPLPVPSFTSQPGVTVCAASAVTYTTQAGQTNYIWSIPGVLNTDYAITAGGIGSSSNSVTLKWFTEGTKTVTINYSNASGCTALSATSSVTTTVNPLPGLAAPSASGPTTFCAGSAVTLGLSSPTSLKFNGVDGRVSFPASADFNYSGSSTLTYESWIYYTSTGPRSGGLFGHFRTTGYGSMQLTFDIDVASNKLKMYMDDYNRSGWLYVVGSSSAIPLDTWVHVALVKTGSNASIYINGVLDGTGTIDSNHQRSTASSNASLGVTAFGGNSFNGKMRETRIWSIARSATDISTNYNNSAFTYPQAGLVSYLKMNEGTGTALSDLSGRNNNGTLNSGVTWSTSAYSSYLWSAGGATSSTISASESGSYSVAVTDANGCAAASPAIVVTANPIPTVAVTAANPAICTGAGTILTATGASTYNWSPNVIEILPLDGMSSAKLAVGLRKLKTSYSGSGIRLRKGSDNSEQNFGFIGSDLDVTAIQTWLNGATGYCITLYDQSGNGGDVTQTIAANQPIFVASGIHGRPILHFNGTQYMNNAVNYTTPYSIIYGARVTGTSSRVLSAKGNNWLLGYWNGAKDQSYFAGWVTPNSTPASDQNYTIYAASGSGTLSTVYRNATQLASNNGGLAGPNGIQLNGAYYAGSLTETSDCDFTDVLIFNSVLSASAITTLNTAISTYYVSANATLSVSPLTTQIYSVTGTNTNGCSNANTTTVTVNTGTHNATTISSCSSYLWPANGQTYTASGNYTSGYNNSNGCASVDTLHLTIKQPTTSIVTAIACASYSWHGNTYSVSTNSPTWTGVNAAGCDSVVTLHLTINPLPAAPAGAAAQSFCRVTDSRVSDLAISGSIVSWYDAAANGNLISNTTALVSSTTYYAQNTDSDTGCTSNTRTAVTATIHEQPTITITDAATCSPNLLTYSCAVTVSSGTVTSTLGTVTNTSGNIWSITNVPKGKDLIVTVADANTCENTLSISAPDCSCPLVIEPVSSGDQSYCTGTTIPALTASVDAGHTVDWYDAEVGGTLIKHQNISYTPTAAGTYYAENRNLTTDCRSAARTAVTLTELSIPVPTFTQQPGDNACTGSDVTYATQSGKTNYIWNIPGTVSVDYTITSGGTGTSSNTVTLRWITTGNKTVTINYQNDAGCSDTVAVASLQTLVSPHAVGGNATATETTICSGSRTTISVTGYTGTIQWQQSDNGNNGWADVTSGTGEISDILTTTNLTSTTYYRTAANSGSCNTYYSTTVCVTVQAHPNVPGVTDGSSCGTGVVALSATANAGETIDWYTDATGGSLLFAGSLNYNTFSLTSNTPFYAEARNIATGCVSDSRAEVVATLNPLPTIAILNAAECAPNLLTYSVSVTAGTGTVTSTSGIVTNTSGNIWTITNIAVGTDVNVTITDVKSCQNTLYIVSPYCPCPIIDAPVSGGDITYCPGSAIPSVSATVPTGITIDWYDNPQGGTLLSVGTTSYTPTAQGMYYAQGRHVINNCISTTRTAITLTLAQLPDPSFTAQPDSVICANTEVTYSTQEGQTNYVWSIPGTVFVDYTITSGGVGSNNNSVTLKYLTAGRKTVTINYTNPNGCAAVAVTSSAITRVNPLPVPTFTVQPGSTACVNTNVTYTTQSGQSHYSWNIPGALSVDYTITSGGIGTTSNTVTLKWITTGSKTVTINYTNSNGCTAAAETLSTTTIVSPLPVPSFTSQPGVTVCAASAVTYTTQAGQTNYIWSIPGVLNTDYAITAGGIGSSSNSVTLKWFTEGTKTVTINYSNASGCTALSATSSVTTTVNPLPGLAAPSASGPTTFCAGSAVTLGLSSPTSLKFNGVDGRVSFPASADFNYSGSSTLTYESWIYYTSTGPRSGGLFGHFRTTGYGSMQLTFDIDVASNKLKMYMDDYNRSGWLYVVGSSSAIPLDTWVHVALVKTGSNASIYINGVLDGTGTIDSNHQRSTASSNASLGVTAFGGNSFNGKMRETRIWSIARSATDISTNYNNSAFTYPQAGLVSYLKMNEGTGTALSDLSGRNNNGTLNSGVTWSTSAYSSYLWSAGGATSSTISASESGSYSVAVTDANGCAAASPAIVVTANPIPTVAVTAANPAICTGAGTILTATGASTYNWSPNVIEILPLDGMSSAKLAVGLRKLKTSYSGSGIRLRKGSDNSEQNFGFIGSDLDVTAIQTWLNGATGYCITLYDQSGNGGDVTQTIAANQPIFVASGIHGRPILHFNGTQYMNNAVNYTTPYSIIYGARVTGTSSRVLSAKGNNWLLGYWNGAKDQSYFAGWVTPNSTPASDQNYTIYAASGSGTLSTVYRNATQLASNNGGLAGPNGIQLNGAYYAGSLTETSDCDFTDVLIFNSVLSASAITTLNTAISTYYVSANATLSVSPLTTQIYSVTGTNTNGCSNANTTTVTVNTGTHNATTISSCSSYLWPANGQTYTASGNYTSGYNNSNGCASVDTLHLTIKQPTTSIVTAIACASYSWHGNTYSVSTNSPTWTGVNAAGCDSVVTLHLTINPLPAAPAGAAAQSFCRVTDSRVSDLAISGSIVSWYDAAANGNLISNTTALVSSTTYYAQNTDSDTGCTSNTRTAVTATIHEQPTITITDAATCSPNLLTYSCAVTVSSGTVTSTLGTVTNTSGNIWSITNVPKGKDLIVTVADANTCENTLSISAPDCSCPLVIEPVSSGDQSYCTGTTIPALTASVDAGHTVDWYDAEVGGTLIKHQNISYTPTAAGTYYAENRNLTTDCRSAARTAVTLTELSIPVPTFTQQPGDNACTGSDVTYATQSGKTNYIWNIPGTVSVDYTITSGGTGTSSNTVTLRWITTGNKTVTINYQNDAGCSDTVAVASLQTLVSPHAVGGNATATETTICSGSRTTISVTGYTGTIQWQQSDNGNNGWADVTSGSDGNNETYTTPSLTATTFYRALITSGGCSQATSNSQTALVKHSFVITSAPTGYTVAQGAVVPILNVQTDSNETLHYQWYSNTDDSTTDGTETGTDNSSYTPDISFIGTSYYYVVISNACGSVSSLTAKVTVTKAPTHLVISVILEGFYNSGNKEMNTTLNSAGLIPLSHPYNVAPWNYSGTESVAAIPAGVVDWVLVELRQAATPAEALPDTKLPGWPKAIFLKSDGSLVDLDGSTFPEIGNAEITDNLYLIISHRNHIAIMSATEMAGTGNNYSYDFTVALDKAYGGGAGYRKINPGVFGMVAADADRDGNISVLDFSAWATDFGKMHIYIPSDTDGDGEVSVLDFSKWASNFGMENVAPLKSATIQGTGNNLVSKFRSQVPTSAALSKP